MAPSNLLSFLYSGRTNEKQKFIGARIDSLEVIYISLYLKEDIPG